MIVVVMRYSCEGGDGTNKGVHGVSVLCAFGRLVPDLEHLLLVFCSTELELPGFVDGSDGLIETYYCLKVRDNWFTGQGACITNIFSSVGSINS